MRGIVEVTGEFDLFLPMTIECSFSDNRKKHSSLTPFPGAIAKDTRFSDSIPAPLLEFLPDLVNADSNRGRFVLG